MRTWRLIWVVALLGLAGCAPAETSGTLSGTRSPGTLEPVAVTATATTSPIFTATNAATPRPEPSRMAETPAPAASPSPLPTAQPPSPPASRTLPTSSTLPASSTPRAPATPLPPTRTASPTAAATEVALAGGYTPVPTPAWAGEPDSCVSGPTGRDAQPSPNAAFWAGKDGDIMTAQGGPCARLVHPKWARFVCWTADSRYAVYSVYDQYGNSAALVFDTVTWKQFGLPQYIGLGDMSGRFADGPVAVAPQKAQVLLGLGNFVTLDPGGGPARVGRRVLDGTGQRQVAVAAWSPDETRLAFLAIPDPGAYQATFFLAAGDGQGPRTLAALPILNWGVLGAGWMGPDLATLVTAEGTWVFDANTLAVVKTPAVPLPTPTLITPPGTATPTPLVPGMVRLIFFNAEPAEAKVGDTVTFSWESSDGVSARLCPILAEGRVLVDLCLQVPLSGQIAVRIGPEHAGVAAFELAVTGKMAPNNNGTRFDIRTAPVVVR